MFCPKCGAKNNEVPIEINRTFCTNCGSTLSEEAQFCVECGSKL